MKDNFSKQAEQYSQFRPQYPPEMIDYILSFVENRKFALDVATGNGQLAKQLSQHFDHVFATDISAEQLSNAAKANNISYQVGPAEKTDFGNSYFDLVTVAQAIHWFDFSKFHDEVYRILNPKGIIAVLGYGLFSTNEAADAIIGRFYTDIIGSYWDKERRYLDELYETIPFPYYELPSKNFSSELDWNFDQLMGYLGTWSAVQHYKDRTGKDPLDIIFQELRGVWNDSPQKVTFNFLLRIGKLNPTHTRL